VVLASPLSKGAYWSKAALGHGLVWLCGQLQTRGNASHHVMGKGVPQQDRFDLATAPYTELLQPSVSGNGFHALSGCGPILTDSLGFIGSHPLSPFPDSARALPTPSIVEYSHKATRITGSIAGRPARPSTARMPSYRCDGSMP
jgi:hypothetical protein